MQTVQTSKEILSQEFYQALQVLIQVHLAEVGVRTPSSNSQPSGVSKVTAPRERGQVDRSPSPPPPSSPPPLPLVGSSLPTSRSEFSVESTVFSLKEARDLHKKLIADLSAQEDEPPVGDGAKKPSKADGDPTPLGDLIDEADIENAHAWDPDDGDLVPRGNASQDTHTYSMSSLLNRHIEATNLSQTGETVEKKKSAGRKSNKLVEEKAMQCLVQRPAKEIALLGNIAEGLSDGTEIDEPEYDVSKFYKQEGIAQAIARSGWFGVATLAIICSNAIYLGIESDYNKAKNLRDTSAVFIVLDNFYCAFFSFELLARFMAFAKKRNCLKDSWFRFDMCLVFTMVLDSWVMAIVQAAMEDSAVKLPTGPLKMLRLLRLARMVRICHVFPELATLMKAIFVAMRAVGSAVVFLVVIIYVWAIAMHQFLKDEEELYPYWGTVTRCMMTLISNGTLGDSIGTVMRDIARNIPAFSAFLAFVLLSAITVTNMLIGLLCEVVSEVANAEKEYATLSRLKSEILVMLRRVDSDGSGSITRAEFISILKDDYAKMILHDVGIDVKHLLELTDMMFSSAKISHISIPEVMELLLASQGDRKPTFQDVVSLLGFQRWSFKNDITHINTDILSGQQAIKTSLAVLKDDVLAMIRCEFIDLVKTVKV